MNSAWFFFLNPICRNSDEVCGFWRYMRYRSIMIQRLHYPRLVWYWEDDAFDSVESSDISNVRDVQPNEVHYVHRSPWDSNQLQPKHKKPISTLVNFLINVFVKLNFIYHEDQIIMQFYVQDKFSDWKIACSQDYNLGLRLRHQFCASLAFEFMRVTFGFCRDFWFCQYYILSLWQITWRQLQWLLLF